MYTPLKDPVHCVLTYQERVTPIRSFPRLLHDALAEDVEFEVCEKSKIERFFTDEGEYAAAIIVHGQFRNRPIAHIVAAIFADDFATLLDARVEAAYVDAYSQLVLDLVKSDRLNLGLRRRRVGFVPPTGWHPVPGLGLEVSFLPPDYPSLHAAITMYPALPVEGAEDPHARQNLHDERIGLGPAEEIKKLAQVETNGRKLQGEEWQTMRELPHQQGRIIRYQVVLRDDRYLYVAKLEAFDGQDLAGVHRTFSEMIGTIEPIPRPVTSRRNRVASANMWSD